MTDRETMQRERDNYVILNQSTAASIEKRQRTIAERDERIAEIDRQLAARPAKYPRYFRHKIGFFNDLAYVRYDSHRSVGTWVNFDGHEESTIVVTQESEADCWRLKGDWLEITAAEAEAMVKPKVEPTTERLVYLVDSARYVPSIDAAEQDAIRARILAASHSVDLRTLWEEPSEMHRDGDYRLAKVQTPSGGKVVIALVYYDAEDNRGAGWYYSHHAPLNDTIIALADPAKLIGGGA